MSWLQRGQAAWALLGTDRGDSSFWFLGGCSLRRTRGLWRPQTRSSTAGASHPASQSFHDTWSSLGLQWTQYSLQDPKISWGSESKKQNQTKPKNNNKQTKPNPVHFPPGPAPLFHAGNFCKFKTALCSPSGRVPSCPPSLTQPAFIETPRPKLWRGPESWALEAKLLTLLRASLWKHF